MGQGGQQTQAGCSLAQMGEGWGGGASSNYLDSSGKHWYVTHVNQEKGAYCRQGFAQDSGVCAYRAAK